MVSKLLLLTTMVVGAAALHRERLFRDMSLAATGPAEGATGATGATGIMQPTEADKVIGQMMEKPLATGPGATGGPEAHATDPASFATGPAAGMCRVMGQVSVGGYTAESFDKSAKLGFRGALAQVLNVDVTLAHVDGVSEAGGASEIKKAKPDAPITAMRRRLLALGDAAVVDYTVAMSRNKGKDGCAKLTAAFTNGSFLKKMVANGAAKATGVTMLKEPLAIGATPGQERKWRDGAGHWHWVMKPNHVADPPGARALAEAKRAATVPATTEPAPAQEAAPSAAVTSFLDDF